MHQIMLYNQECTINSSIKNMWRWKWLCRLCFEEWWSDVCQL